MRLRLATLLLAGLVACDHSVPFAAGSYTVGVPATTGPQVRLTYNPGDDYGAAWLPDGGSFIYSTQRRDRPDHDHCFATMPAQGGTITSEFCNTAAAAAESTNAFFAAAVSKSSQLGYVRASVYYLLGAIAPRYQELVVAPLAHPDQVRVLESLPYPGPSGRPHDSLDFLAWLDDTSVVYLGQRVDYPRSCSSCAPDTVRTGLEIVRLDFGGPQPVMTLLPGTDSATTLAVVPPDTVYFALAGDSRVYRLALDSDSLTVVHDFGAGQIPSGLQVAGSRMVAVVSDQLESVDLQSGTETLITATLQWAHPAIRPGGKQVVADHFNPDGTTDLWLLQLP